MVSTRSIRHSCSCGEARRSRYRAVATPLSGVSDDANSDIAPPSKLANAREYEAQLKAAKEQKARSSAPASRAFDAHDVHEHSCSLKVV